MDRIFLQMVNTSRRNLKACSSFVRLTPRPHHMYVRPLRMDTAQLTLVRPPFDHPDFLFE
jgi:hypothetical protein